MYKAQPISPTDHRRFVVALVGASAALLALAAPAAAQSNGNSSQFNGGYSASNFNRGIDVATRDENNNQLFINGRMSTPNGSVFSDSQGFSRSGFNGGVGAGGATAIGNNLNVVVQGSWNRVVVDSTQVNNGDVSAQTNLNGAVNLQ